MAVAGCISPVAGPSGRYAKPIGNAPVTANPSPYSAALVCLAQYATRYGVASPRIAVGRISDYTGKEEGDGSGRKLTQGASLLAYTAFAKAGARLVERYDTSISELELKYANNKLISDDAAPVAPGLAPTPQGYRKIYAGQIPGSDFYLIGGITELNFNIRSSGVDIGLGYANADDGAGLISGKLYVMNIAMDLRLVDTRTQEVVDVISYQKQLIGREIGAGVFRFFGQIAVDVSAGEGALEPTQLAVRSLIERAVVEIMANLYGAPGPGSCMSADPIGGGTTGLTGSYTPAYNNLDQNNARTREQTGRWDVRSDPGPAGSIRGRY